MYQYIENSGVNEILNINGFVIIDLVASSIVESLVELYNNTQEVDVNLFQVSIVNKEKDPKDKIVELFSSTLGNFAPGYTPVAAGFISKTPGPDTAMRIHQDWNIVDERQSRSLAFWCPLQHVSKENGALFVLPGSHAVRKLRGSNIPFSCRDIQDVPFDSFVELKMEVGQCVIYDPCLIHRSAPNHSKDDRVAAIMGLKKKSDSFLHYTIQDSTPADCVSVYEVQDSFFDDFDFKSNQLPTSARLLRHESYDVAPISLEDLSAFL